MQNEILDDIKKYAQKKITESMDYCGVCEAPNFTALNSTLPNGQDFIITIKVEDKIKG